MSKYRIDRRAAVYRSTDKTTVGMIGGPTTSSHAITHTTSNSLLILFYFTSITVTPKLKKSLAS